MARVARSATSIAPRVTRVLSFLGFALSVHTAPAAAQVPAAVPPSRGGHLAPPPWSGVRANPPRALARAWATPPPVRHPALHGARTDEGPVRPLFPRAEDVLRQKQERQAAMRRHPAGKGSSEPAVHPGERSSVSPTPAPHPGETPKPSGSKVATGSCSSGRVRVERGDSLWTIATSLSDPVSDERVAHLSDRIFEANRAVIGADPDLIHPGQELSVPKDCQK